MRLAATAHGIGDDGKEYTIHGYKKMLPHGVEESLCSHMETSDGEQVYCENEVPLVFWIAKTRLKIRCSQGMVTT